MFVVEFEDSEEKILEGLPDVEVVEGKLQPSESLVEDLVDEGSIGVFVDIVFILLDL